MPTLPAAGYNTPDAPSIAPSPDAGTPYQSGRAATPEAFGGLSATALSNLGTSFEKVANTIGTRALELQDEYDKTVTLERRTNAERKANAVLYGDLNDPTSIGHFGLEGRAKLEARPKTIAALNAIYDNAGQGLSPKQKRLFDEQTRAHRLGVEANIALDSVNAMKKFTDETNKGAVTLAAQNADRVALGDDEPAWATEVGKGVQTIQAAGETARKAPELIEAEVNAFRAGRLTERAGALMNRDPEAAMRLLDRHRGFYYADPSAFEAIYGQAKAKVEARQIDELASPGGRAPGGGGPAGGGASRATGLIPHTPGGDFLTGTGLTADQYQTFRSHLASRESSRYDQPPNAGGYSGRYQMGRTEIRETAERLGVPVPSQQEFLANPELQERFLESYTLDHHKSLMAQSAAYRNASPPEKAAILMGAHLGGVKGVTDYLNSDGKINRADSNGTRIGDYVGSMRQAMAGGGAPATSAATAPTPAAAPTAAGTAPGAAAATAPADARVEIIDRTAEAGFGQKFGPLVKPQGMVIHHTAMGRTAEDVLAQFKKTNFPAQFIIDREGKIHRALPEGYRGQHTRNASGNVGVGTGNHNLEGIEIIADDDGDVLPIQQEAAARLVAQQAQKYGYDPKTAVYGHGELDPGRKQSTEGMSTVSRIRRGELGQVADAGPPGGGSGTSAPPGAGGDTAAPATQPPGAAAPTPSPATPAAVPSLASEIARIQASPYSQEVKDKAIGRVNQRYAQQTTLWEQHEDTVRRRLESGDTSVTQEFINAEADAGRLGPQQRQSLQAYRANALKEQLAQQQAMALVNGAKSGELVLDPTNEQHRKAVDLDYANTAQNWKPEEAWQNSLAYMRKVNVVPTPVKSLVTGNLYSGNEGRALTGARQYRELVALNPMLGEGFNADAKAMAATINTMASYGMMGKEAFAQAQAQLRAPQAEQEARKGAFNSVRGETERDRLASDSNAISSKFVGYKWLGDEPTTIPPEMLGEFRELTQTFYGRTGNLDAAYQAAYDTARTKWSPSRVGGAGHRWMKDAPEALYAAPGRTDNADWQNQQLVSDVNKNAPKPLTHNQLHIVPAPAGPDTPPGSKPGYFVWYWNEAGQVDYVRDANQQQLVWRPDWTQSEVRAKEAEDLRRRHEERARGKEAPAPNTFIERLQQVPQRLRERTPAPAPAPAPAQVPAAPQPDPGTFLGRLQQLPSRLQRQP